MWKGSSEKQKQIESFARKAMQVARHVRSIFHLTNSSHLNNPQTQTLLRKVVAGLHLDPGDAKKELLVTEVNRNTRENIKAGG